VHIIYPAWTDQPVPWDYQEQIWQTGQYLRKYAAPLIFMFAFLSLILSSMQVLLAARGLETWETFVRVSWGFAVAAIIFTTVPVFGAFAVAAMVVIAQGQFAMKAQLEDRRSRRDVESYTIQTTNGVGGYT
jgi:hypothetical protein